MAMTGYERVKKCRKRKEALVKSEMQVLRDKIQSLREENLHLMYVLKGFRDFAFSHYRCFSFRDEDGWQQMCHNLGEHLEYVNKTGILDVFLPQLDIKHENLSRIYAVIKNAIKS